MKNTIEQELRVEIENLLAEFHKENDECGYDARDQGRYIAPYATSFAHLFHKLLGTQMPPRPTEKW